MAPAPKERLRSALARLRGLRARRAGDDLPPDPLALALDAVGDLWPRLVGTPDAPVRSALFVAPTRDCGATAVAAATAIDLARHLREPVALVELDLEAPRLAALLGAASRPGTSELLLGQADLDAARLVLPDHPHVLAVGAGAPRRLLPGEFAVEAFADLRRRLAERCRTQVLVAPPLETCKDVRLFAGAVDGVVQVVRAGSTTKSELARSLELLDDSRARLVGAVLTGFGEVGDRAA